MRHTPWLLSFFLGAPAVLILSLLTLQRISPFPSISPTKVLAATTDFPDSNDSLFSSTIDPKIVTADARPLILRNYLQRYSSPLEPYSRLLVQISDKYSLDYRLLVAIAQQESNLCKKIPENSYNCWGFGIYGELTTRFPNYPQAIETVARTLKYEYIDKGLTTPEKIMAKYTPPSVVIGGPWAKGVSQFLQELE